MKIILEKKIRKRNQLELARLQDEVIELLYSVCRENEPVFHGGTAIWRCYDGNRFSEALDFYGSSDKDIEGVLRSELEARGLSLDKYKKAPNVTYAKISNRFTTMKLEMSEKNIEHKVVKKYEKVDGSYIDIYTLSAEDLIVEKMNAFLNRRFIRDIYDVYHLSSIVDNSSNGVSGKLNYLPEPIDEKNLKTLVYSGVAPSYKEMVKTIRRRFG